MIIIFHFEIEQAPSELLDRSIQTLCLICLYWAAANLNGLIRDLVPEIIDSGPMCITDLFQDKYLAYFNPK